MALIDIRDKRWHPYHLYSHQAFHCTVHMQVLHLCSITAAWSFAEGEAIQHHNQMRSLVQASKASEDNSTQKAMHGPCIKPCMQALSSWSSSTAFYEVQGMILASEDCHLHSQHRS